VAALASDRLAGRDLLSPSTHAGSRGLQRYHILPRRAQ